MKNKCTHCRWEYPDEYLNPLMTTEGIFGQVCGICALAYMNKMTGEKRKKFDGESAEELRVLAVQWRKTHANQKPQVN